MNWRKLKSKFIVVLLLSLAFSKNVSGINHYHLSTLICNSDPGNRTIKDTTILGAHGVQDSTGNFILKLINQLYESGPAGLKSYSGIIYRKIRITTDTVRNTKDICPDINIVNLKVNVPAFASEKLVHHKVVQPRFNQEEILSSKTEGDTSAVFTGLNDQISKISLTNPFINLLDKQFISPFTTSGTDHYTYSLTDSTAIAGHQLIKIVFQPLTGQNGIGFGGVAIVSRNGLKIQKIFAHLVSNTLNDSISLTIEQSFVDVDGFQLTSEIRSNAVIPITTTSTKFPKNIISGLSGCYSITGITSVLQQNINPKLKPANFRIATLLTDSAFKADQMNKQLKMIRLLAEGKLNFGYFDLNYDKLFDYNLFEGLKLGLEGESNLRLSSFFTIGGFIGYGLHDQSIRHGEWVNIYPLGKTRFRIYLGYKDRNVEYGESEFLETQSLINPENYRNLLITNMYATKRVTAGIEFRPFDKFNLFLFTDQSDNRGRTASVFYNLHPFDPVRLTRSGVKINFSPGRIFNEEDGHLDEVSHSKSDFFITFIQGFSVLGNQDPYAKIEFKGKLELPDSWTGTSTIMFRGGYMTENAPLIEYFNGNGSYAGDFTMMAPYSFSTMKQNEFAAQWFWALYLRHNFSKLFFPENFKKRPEIVFAQNVGAGRLDDAFKTQYLVEDYRKGFFESGLELNNLLRMGYISLGTGIYYRYGPYRLNAVHDNFAYKFGFLINL